MQYLHWEENERAEEKYPSQRLYTMLEKWLAIGLK